MTLRLNGSTSGYVEIDAPATAGSNTLVLPTGNGSNGQALQTNGSGVLSWGPGVSNDGQLCKAWVNFNGTGTVAIRASYNVSSITDNGTGDYTVNFTTALPDANYSQSWIAGSGTGSGNYYSTTLLHAPTASSSRIRIFNSVNFNVEDAAQVNAALFR